MNYTSPEFWLLFVAVFLLYWRLGHRGQNRVLLVASYVFYGFWDYRFLFLILISTVIDYVGGLGVAGVRLPARRVWGLAGLIVVSSILLCTGVDYASLGRGLAAGDGAAVAGSLPRQPDRFLVPLGAAAACAIYGAVLPSLYAASDVVRRKAFLTISMVANLSILGFFKYYDFFAESLTAAFSAVGLAAPPMMVLHLVLPAGISFYTFQAMSYTIDIYRGDAEPTEDLADFALFICFFPHLVAGPIMRAHSLLPQVVGARTVAASAWEEGLWLVLIGLFKKLVIADNMALVADAVFFPWARGSTVEMSGPEVLVGVYAFAFQIYADFSGYSCIARGISKWLGYELVINFNLPYLAVSPSDFWKRWHISLSTWLRDYLYIPLGGNRYGTLTTYRNLLLTMVLGGLWHGASWTFVAWGAYHGVILCLARAAGVSDATPGRTTAGMVSHVARVVLMFHLTCLGWMIFRSDSLGTCAGMLGRLATDARITSFAVSCAAFLAFYAGPFFAFECATGGEVKMRRIVGSHWLVKAGLATYLVLSLVVFRAGRSHEFIYFQF